MKIALKLQAAYVFISRLSKREKFILYGAAFFVSLTLVDRLIISPVFLRIGSLDKETAAAREGIKNSLRILEQKERILAARNKYSYLSGHSESTDADITSLLKEIESLAGKSSVYLIDMKPSSAKAQAGQAEKFLIVLNCEAQMEELIEFMYNIENSDKLLMIERYQISPKSKESTVAKCAMSISKVVMP